MKATRRWPCLGLAIWLSLSAGCIPTRSTRTSHDVVLSHRTASRRTGEPAQALLSVTESDGQTVRLALSRTETCRRAEVESFQTRTTVEREVPPVLHVGAYVVAAALIGGGTAVLVDAPSVADGSDPRLRNPLGQDAAIGIGIGLNVTGLVALVYGVAASVDDVDREEITEPDERETRTEVVACNGAPSQEQVIAELHEQGRVVAQRSVGETTATGDLVVDVMSVLGDDIAEGRTLTFRAGSASVDVDATPFVVAAEQQAWSSELSSDALRAFLVRFPNGAHAQQARSALRVRVAEASRPAPPELSELPISEYPEPGAAWEPFATWTPTPGVTLVVEVTTRNEGLALSARPRGGTGQRTELSVLETYRTLEMRALPGGRAAAIWIDRTIDEDVDSGPAWPERAVLFGWNAATNAATVIETWRGIGPVPTWLADGLVVRIEEAIARGDSAAASAGISWLDWSGDRRSARRLEAVLARVERAATEGRIRQQIADGRLGEAEAEIETLRRDRAAAASVRGLAALLRDAERMQQAASGESERGSELAGATAALNRLMFTPQSEFHSLCSELASVVVRDHEVSVALRDDSRMYVGDPERCMAYDLMRAVNVVLREVPTATRVRATYAVRVTNRYGEETGWRVTHRGGLTRGTFDRIQRRWLLIAPGAFGWTEAMSGCWALMIDEQ